MDQPAIINETSKSIKELLDVTVETLNGLKNLCIDVTWDMIVIYIIGAKLNAESRKQWQLSIAVSDELPTLADTKMFLKSRFRSLEFLKMLCRIQAQAKFFKF